MDGLNPHEINQQRVRPGVWLLACGAVFFAIVVGLGLSFIEPAGVEETAVALNMIDPNAPQGRPADDVINPTLDPAQVMVSNRARFEVQAGDVSWQVIPRATFIIAGRIVGNQKYYDEQAEILPADLLIAWGELSNPAVDQWMRWTQFDRLGYFEWSDELSYSGEFVNSHAANVHMMPATENLERAIDGLELNDTVLMAGLLVDMRSDGIGMDTSLTRTDTGLGACEIFYVERLVIDGMEYR